MWYLLLVVIAIVILYKLETAGEVEIDEHYDDELV